MIIQNLIMSIFCTIDKTMVFENLQKIQKTRKRLFVAIFYEYSSYKTYLTEELIYTYYYTKLSYIAFIFYLFLTSHVNRHALWLQWTIWYSNWRRIYNWKRKRNKAEGCHTKMITSYRRRSHLKKEKKTKIERKNSKSTERKKKKKKGKQKYKRKEQHIVSIEPTPA